LPDQPTIGTEVAAEELHHAVVVTLARSADDRDVYPDGQPVIARIVVTLARSADDRDVGSTTELDRAVLVVTLARSADDRDRNRA
jgi:hypothetical protein